jgi:hypothetical protein
VTNSSMPQVSVAKKRQPLLQALIIAAMGAPLIVSMVVETPIPFETRIEAAFLWLLCLVPSWHYVASTPMNRRPIPFMPMIGILYGLYYALGAALGAYGAHYKIVLSPRRDYDDAIFVALYGWMALAVGYFVAKAFAPPRKRDKPSEVPEWVLRRYGSLLMIAGVLLQAIRLVRPIPVDIAGILVFVATLGWFGSGLLITMAVQQRLNLPFRLLTYGGVAAFLIMAVGTGSVANAAFYGAVVFVCAWIGRGGLKLSWIVSAILGLLVIITLRGVSDQYRQIAWYAGGGGGPLSRSKLFFKLARDRVNSDGVDGAVEKGFQTSAGRSANLELLADVIIRTPREIPYWGGETYLSLVGSFVPRILWPDKPTKELGQAFGHRYSYIGANDLGTALNLPILVEFYVNFGIAGVILGMCLVGVIYHTLERLVNHAGQDTLHSLVGVVILIPLANIESDFSLGFGGLILNGAALWLVLRTIRRSGMASNRVAPSQPSRLPPFASQTRTN